jgi:hypothetical protein
MFDSDSGVIVKISSDYMRDINRELSGYKDFEKILDIKERKLKEDLKKIKIEKHESRSKTTTTKWSNSL